MPPGAEAPRVALIIPTWNGGPLFERVLEMWRSQVDVPELELCCPDSGSSDGTREAVRRAGGRVVPVEQREFSHGGTRNEAVEGTDADFVILTVQDALPLSTRVAAELLAPLLADDGLAATYGRQVPRPGCHPVLAERIGGWAGGEEPVEQALGDREWTTLDPFERLGLIRYDHVIACMRRSAWEAEPFAPVSFGEDVDWAHRVIRGGGRLAFVPTAVVEHSHDRSAWDEARRIYCDHRNLVRLVGLVTVPDRRRIKENVGHARAHYAHLVEARDDVDATTRANWRRWADKLALYENWAQYLGANLSRKPWFAPVDRWLRRGI